MLHRLRELRRSLQVTADTTTSSIMTRAAWSALFSGVFFGLFSLFSDDPAPAAVRGTTFALLMSVWFPFVLLFVRARLQRRRER